MVTASKVPMLKAGEYELWKMRIEQYMKMLDYSMWEVIQNGDTLPAKGADGTPLPIKTNEEKAQRRLEIKTHNILLMGIPNEYQLSFSNTESAKELMDVVQLRFGGNEATKKSRKNLL